MRKEKFVILKFTSWQKSLHNRVENEPRVIKAEYVSPQKIKDENLYKEKLISWLELLENEFSKKAADSKYVKIIKKMRIDLSDILSEYYNGNIGGSYEKMKNIISEMMEEDSGLAISTIQKSIAFNDVEEVFTWKSFF